MFKKAKQPDMREPFYNFWARGELSEARIFGVSMVLLLLSVVAIVYQYQVITQKDHVIRRLANERIMIGFADENGVFRSVDKRPEAFVYRYAATFVSNLYNYTKQSIGENVEAARDMLDARVALNYTDSFKERVKKVRDGDLTQLYVIERHKVIEDDQGYTVVMRGYISKYASRIHVDTYPLEVRVRLAKVAFQDYRPEGLTVLDVTDKRI